ncbi:MAG: hypothetical protein A3C02_00785 [Candidatus Andersenbacteria bacterium RIFCSPHIGHO2_02_FULL_45_11]|uniref:Uncharacterized protein n=1 Tax=Candidatus Andersenbacteria bacterium RIFCSPHIGHO2_12_FULL_45_11 TaxID=1797281 RepID=A0A1G1X3X8_9BACT|nr:MAG: hypothetical protein A2805_01645 [Candidatus Andersenbacteria bacterium RIFCSPHIGHO2_01_FULL_46_36]OGY33320.1 MAG: hypothetical protein A3C02_00785 [Candidatus Andersenbacteria bacterium RIFCSPHIGHO2_02_FULL_45_11]OGY34674.1 MAG: hypothetical protein A3D99_05030 [Candidatus Andersenbacteria bacterium RIFCSPHIGHO2_12_FULL_45_11]
MQLSTYDTLLTSIADRFYRDLSPNQKPPRNEYLANLKNDLLGLTATVVDDPPWMLWLKVQERRIKMNNFEFKSLSKDKISAEEIFCMAEIALHLRANSYRARLTTASIESISGAKIDHNVTAKDLVNLRLPDYLWIEWPSFPKKSYDPWITRTVGMFISRFVLLDAPRHRLVTILEHPTAGQTYCQELIKALVENTIANIPCLGYQLIIVQQDDHGYRYIPCMFGHELAEPLTTMLALHKETSDRDKPKHLNAEQVWSNAAIRLLLIAASRGWFTDPAKQMFIEDASSAVLPNSPHVLFARKGTNGREIAIRPDYHTQFKPFAITND